MPCVNVVVVFIMALLNITSGYDPDILTRENYSGELFPVKYLEPETAKPTSSELNHYIISLRKVLQYFYVHRNTSDVNTGMGTYILKVILKRVFKDYEDRMGQQQHKVLKGLLHKTESILDHFTYYSERLVDIGRRVSTFFRRDDSAFVYAIGKFNRNRLKKWIYRNDNINDYVMDIDARTLPKYTYVKLVENRTGYFIEIPKSDLCITRLIFHPDPIDVTKLHPCRRDDTCKYQMSTDPSITYTLSHRMLNLYLHNAARRCYIDSVENDAAHLDRLCAFMYREAVYLAMRGYFFRDIFMEHVALCSLLGYEEFHRPTWMHKITKWIDKKGCIHEDRNFLLNRSTYHLSLAETNMERKRLLRNRRSIPYTQCDTHQMILLVVNLGHAIRYAYHGLGKITSIFNNA